MTWRRRQGDTTAAVVSWSVSSIQVACGRTEVDAVGIASEPVDIVTWFVRAMLDLPATTTRPDGT